MRESGHDHLIGRTIAGKFVVEQLLGAGAMGAVFRARQVALEKTVAIKVLHGEHAHDATFAARFHREAKAASRLNHPNSMQVIDFGAEPDGLLYIAMEYLDGRSLHRLLRDEWPLGASRVADILMQTLAALAVAHDMGVVHRDLKPENIMVLQGTDDDGRPRDIVKVCDFGIAKITDPRAYRGTEERESNAPVTTAGFLVGTPEYMSPEQGRGEKLDPRSDLYSIGVILFEMLSGRVPFEAENAIGVVLKHITDVPPRPSELAPGVDLCLEAICLRALRKASNERYASAREMRAELRSVGGSPSAGDRAAAAAGGNLAATFGPANAPTVELATPGPPGRSTAEALPQPTLLGTTTTIPGSPRRTAFVVGVAALLTGAALATTLAMMSRQHVRPSSATARATPMDPAPPASLEAPPAALSSTAPEAPSLPSARGEESPVMPLRATVRNLPTAPTPPPATASRHGPAAPAAASVARRATSPFPATAAAEATPAGPPVAPAAPVDAPDPSFEPERGYVEVGLVNAQGARESAVRGALRGVGLARCYRGALRARGGRASGTATLNLSFDETGVARSAIVTGGEFLPGLAGCVQTASAGVRISRSHVDPGGGTAEVVLAFKVP
jgi:eukaryotic-like serine/threonine-protein kinase